MIDRFTQGALSFWAQLLGGNAWVKAISISFGAALAWILPSQAVRDTGIACIVLVALDTITGMVAAIRSGKPISSAKFSRVLSKLIAYGSVVSVVSICGKYLPGMVDFRIPLITASLYLILATEGISVLENAASLGVQLPPGLVKWLKGKLNDQIDSIQKEDQIGSNLQPRNEND
jgi:phage-related holin